MVRAGECRGIAVALSFIIGVSFGLMPTVAMAHGDHAGEMPAAAIGPMAPRIVAQSNDFELVGVAKGKTLTIYLDRFKDDAPVTGAKLDIQVDGQTITAKPGEDGTYTVTGDWVAMHGHHDMVITVMTDKDSDLLAGTLDVEESEASLGEAAGAAHAATAAKRPLSPDRIVAFLLGMLAMLALMAARAPAAAAMSRLKMRATFSGIATAAFTSVKQWPATMAKPSNAPGNKVTDKLSRLAARTRRSAAAVRGPRLVAVRQWAVGGLGRLGAVVERVLAPLQRSGEQILVPVVAFICLVVIALFLISRSVFAHGSDEHEQAPAAAAGAGNAPHRLMDGTLFVPKNSQRLLNLRTAITAVSEVSRTIRVVGEVQADPGTSGEIHATIRGRLEPASGVWPRVGQKVEAGQVLAWVVPVVNPIDRGIILQQVAQIDHEIELVQERIKSLSADGDTASPRDVDDARSDLANLARRRAAIAAIVHDRDTLRAPLLAPSSGVISASFAVAGQVVDEQQKLFDVVDPKRLWVQAYAYDVMAIGNVVDANAVGSTGHNYHLKFVSRGPQLQKQTIPLYFQIENPDSTLSVGSLVSVLVKTTGERSGVVLPRAAVVHDLSGQDIVWKHAYPESFVPMPVRIEPIDGNSVLVVAGLGPNTRVVVDAADLLNEVR